VVIYGLTTMASSWGTSIFSSTIDAVSKEYHVASIVGTLGVTLFLFGFGIGPLLWAPLSEIYGRRLAVFPPYFIGACFTFATASSKDLQSILITRFFTGFFCSAPVTNTGGVLGDIYSPAQRAAALAGYSMAVAGGPLLSPIVAGAMLVSGVNWRWTEYVRVAEACSS
jgi:MFS family permease